MKATERTRSGLFRSLATRLEADISAALDAEIEARRSSGNPTTIQAAVNAALREWLKRRGTIKHDL